MACLATRQGRPERALACYAWYRDALAPTGEVWPFADAWAAYAEVIAGRAEDALPRLDPSTEPPLTAPLVQLWRAEACLQLGRLHEARALATAAVEAGRRRGETTYQGWGLLMLGDVAATRAARGADAERRYAAALALARDHGFRPLEARARLGLGAIYARTRRGDDARRELDAARALLTALGMNRWSAAAGAVAGTLRPRSRARGDRV
jgi:tetratricopeptide (TPR) repeat protein